MTATSACTIPNALPQLGTEQWNRWSIDLATDRDQWQHALSDHDKSLVYWALSSLMVAEERITTKFAGLVMAQTARKKPASRPDRSTRPATCSSTPAFKTK